MSGKLPGLGLAAAILLAAAVPAGATLDAQSGSAADAFQIAGSADTRNEQEYEVNFDTMVLRPSNAAQYGLPIVSVNLASASKYVLNPYRIPVTLNGQEVRDTIVCQPVVIRSFSNVPIEVTATVNAETPKGSRVMLVDTPEEASQPGLGLFVWAEFANGTTVKEAEPDAPELSDGEDAPDGSDTSDGPETADGSNTPDTSETPDGSKTPDRPAVETAMALDTAMALEPEPEGVTVAELPDGLDDDSAQSDAAPEASAVLPEEETVRETADGAIRRTIPASEVKWQGAYSGGEHQAVRGVTKYVLTIPAADAEPSVAYARFFGVAGIPSEGAWSAADTANLSITLSFKAEDGTVITNMEDYLAPQYGPKPWAVSGGNGEG